MSVVFFLSESMVYLLVSMYFWFVSRTWQYLQIINLVLMVVTLVFLQYMPESPKFLISNGRYADAKEALIFLGTQNGFSRETIIERLEELDWPSDDWKASSSTVEPDQKFDFMAEINSSPLLR